MVAVTDPQLGEIVLDPACGTGGFLAEAFDHLEKQCKTVQDRKALAGEEHSWRRGQAAPLHAGQMNLLLHGLDAPAIDYGNSLAVKLTELGDRDRVDVILTNPPFGGEEEAGIRSNFPADKQTAKLLCFSCNSSCGSCGRPVPDRTGGRAGVVVPNGTLFGDGVCARIKEELLKEFNLHTIVRLPNGVFAPYTAIPTNLLFFRPLGPNEGDLVLRAAASRGTKNYSKTSRSSSRSSPTASSGSSSSGAKRRTTPGESQSTTF